MVPRARASFGGAEDSADDVNTAGAQDDADCDFGGGGDLGGDDDDDCGAGCDEGGHLWCTQHFALSGGNVARNMAESCSVCAQWHACGADLGHECNYETLHIR